MKNMEVYGIALNIIKFLLVVILLIYTNRSNKTEKLIVSINVTSVVFFLMIALNAIIQLIKDTGITKYTFLINGIDFLSIVLLINLLLYKRRKKTD